MIFTKIIRKKDKKVFWIAEDSNGGKYLCTSSQRIVKHLRDVRDFYNRFRYFIIGIDND